MLASPDVVHQEKPTKVPSSQRYVFLSAKIMSNQRTSSCAANCAAFRNNRPFLFSLTSSPMLSSSRENQKQTGPVYFNHTMQNQVRRPAIRIQTCLRLSWANQDLTNLNEGKFPNLQNLYSYFVTQKKNHSFSRQNKSIPSKIG